MLLIILNYYAGIYYSRKSCDQLSGLLAWKIVSYLDENAIKYDGSAEALLVIVMMVIMIMLIMTMYGDG